MAAPRCRNCGGVDWVTEGSRDERGRCGTCREFPTLGYGIGAWIEEMCVIPDRAVAGREFKMSDQQWRHLLHQFRLWPDAVVDEDRPASPFFYVGSLIVRSQKWGKGPFSAARICAQAEGPVLFAGWDAAGQPVGMPWATPHIQVAAVAEDQTDNIWRALKPMIELGPLAHVISDTGLDRMNLRSGGIIEPVSSNALTRLGARISYVEIDQPESMTKRNGGDRLVDVLLRNLSGMGGRWSATGNAHDPTEQSVQQVWIDKPGEDVYVDYPEPLSGSWMNKRERRRILKHAYEGSPWVDVDRIESDCDRLERKNDPGQAERFFGNRVVAGSAKAFNLETFKGLRRDEGGIPAGRHVVLGFDGALKRDGTGLVAADVETGHMVIVGYWQRPPSVPEDDPWIVPVTEVDEAIDYAFRRWKVWRLYGDPPHWKYDLDRWAGLYGADRVVLWWTNFRKRMAYALKSFRNDMREAVMSYGAEPDLADVMTDRGWPDPGALLEEHVGNAVKQLTEMRDDDDEDGDGARLWLITKDGENSPRKIDLAMASCLAWRARGDAIREGVLNETPHGRASWSGGQAAGNKSVDRSEYVPCTGCGKPIHPRLHAPDAPERGRCMKCRASDGDVTSAKW